MALLALLVVQLTAAVLALEGRDCSNVYAIYFPQFHEDKLNNRLWGKGFNGTFYISIIRLQCSLKFSVDWNNLNASLGPNRLGSPLLRPTELGYYDLLNVDVRRQQGVLATQYGIDGFIYHHYWFYHMFMGPAVNAVLDRIVEDGHPNIPFALNWAQESWTNTWNGRERYKKKKDTDTPIILINQLYPDESSFMIEEHYDYLKKFFHHRNYILVHGCPLLFVYGASQRPEVLAIRQRLRALAMKDGFPAPGLHIPAMNAMVHHALYQNDSRHSRINRRELSMEYNDAVQFYPYISNPERQMKLPDRCLQQQHPWRETLKKPTYVGVVTMYDNTPRRDIPSAKIGNRMFYSGELEGQAKSLEHDVLEAILFEMCCQRPFYRDKGGKFILINAWNEWGEGMVLEPNNIYDRRLLEAVWRAKRTAANMSCASHTDLLTYRAANGY